MLPSPTPKRNESNKYVNYVFVPLFILHESVKILQFYFPPVDSRFCCLYTRLSGCTDNNNATVIIILNPKEGSERYTGNWLDQTLGISLLIDLDLTSNAVLGSSITA